MTTLRESAPLRRLAGEREGPAPKAWEGEVAIRRVRACVSTYLTPTLSPRKQAERESAAGVPNTGGRL
jgi:hypothetical protein